VIVQVQLRRGAPLMARAALMALPEVNVTTGQTDLVSVDTAQRPLRLLSGASCTGESGDEDVVELVVARSLTARERSALEADGVSWCDARGALHLVWPGVYVHVDHGTRRAPSAPKAPGSGLGVASIRGVQVMLEEPNAEWSVSTLARSTGLSVGQAHNLLTRLDSEGQLVTEGKGPKMRRRLRDRNDTLDWLAAIERGRRRPDTAASYIYARTFNDLVERFSAIAEAANVTYALTGVAGTFAWGHPVVTNPAVVQARVGPLEPSQTLELMSLEHLDAQAEGRGVNIELWRDVGELGTFRREQIGSTLVAPKTRVYLDLLRQRGRNQDAAQLFKEQALG